MDISRKIMEAVEYIQDHYDVRPRIGMILGSGLGEMAEEIENKVSISYRDIPNFPVSTVQGHEGNLVFGQLKGKQVAVMQGRLHYYEGYSMQEITFPIRVMDRLGIEMLIVTNAAGGINENFHAGDLMVIKDIINLQGDNPLIGPNLNDFGKRFPDMSQAFSPKLQDILIKSGEKANLSVQKGVYVAMKGPNYETPAEVQMLKILGADAVGMSTVPEVIAARHSGIEVLGISCISNMAAGILKQPLNHAEVIETTQRVKEDFKKIIKETLKNI